MRERLEHPRWRPAQSIQIKALGLVWNRGKLLASEVCRDDGTLKGIRPLGGSLKFGESWRDGLDREFLEELGTRIKIVGDPLFLENIYVHEDARGHEWTVVCDVQLQDRTYDDMDSIKYVEDTGQKCRAGWFDLDRLDRLGLDLYPNGRAIALQNP